MSTTQYSKEQTKDYSKEETKDYSKELNYTKEHYTTNEGKTNVTVERVEIEPVIVEHHHHHTHTVIHPEIVREHDTTEIRQIVKPIYEHVKTGETEEYAGKEVRVIDKAEDTEESRRKLEAHKRDILAKADVTHTEEKTSSVDTTKVKDIHATHKVIEEVTPVIIRDVHHNKTIHKDETVVERIHHAPEVHKEELEVQHKEGSHTMDTREGLHTKNKEGKTKGTRGNKEGKTKEKQRHTELNLGHGHKEGHTTKGTTGLKAEHVKETRIKKGVE
jgi:hypothetical protein